MKGNVIGYDADTNTGAISGHDGKRYDFVTQEWHGRGAPHHGDVVDFQPDGARASQIYLVDAEYVSPGWVEFLFSPHGRISRSQYWLRWVLPFAAIYVVLLLLTLATQTSAVGVLFALLLLLFALAMLWPSIAIIVKRVHDRDWPWPFILVLFIPLVGLWPAVEIMFLRGTIGPNRFGADPVPRS